MVCVTWTKFVTLSLLLLWVTVTVGEQSEDQKLASRRMRVRAFMSCKRDCSSRCDPLVYSEKENKEYCHNCLQECIQAFEEQAKSLGVDFNVHRKREPRKDRRGRMRHERLNPGKKA